MKALAIAPGLELPLDAVTQTFGILAVRGAGKSNLGAVMAEEMFRAQLPFVVVDPVGSWWGLRSSSDGRGPGLAIPIFGGRHGDVPLERNGGQLLADLVVDERLSCVLDISELSEGDKTRFLIDFAERLYRRNQEPLHLFLEEADDYAPQRPFREQARLLGAWENVVRRGRARGLGITMISQRSASLNKNVLTQIETLFVLRTTSPQDRTAIEAWVKYHGQAKQLLESLPGLADGEAWVWSPQWLHKLERVRTRRRSTFDSGATPKQLRGTRAPATLADVDLPAVRVRMQQTIERAKQEDPRELRRRIAELERQLAQGPAAEATIVEVPVLKPADLQQIEWIAQRVEVAAKSCVEKLAAAEQSVQKIVKDAQAAIAPVAPRPVSPAAAPQRAAPAIPARGARPAASTHSNGRSTEPLGRGERRILTALAQYPAGRMQVQIAILTGYAHSGGGFRNYLGALRSRGLIENAGDQLRITAAGNAALGTFSPLPRGEELLAHWRTQLGKAERLILEELYRAYPQMLSRDEIAERTGYEVEGGGFRNAMSRLRTLELVSGKGELRASEDLFS